MSSNEADTTEDTHQVEVKRGRQNPCFLCMGTCILVTAIVVVVVAAGLHFFCKTAAYSSANATDGCQAPPLLTACDADTEPFAFYRDHKIRACLARWQLDPGCLRGSNRFTSATECRQRCEPLSAGVRQAAAPECMAPVEASTCSDDDFRDREYSFFFDGGNCSLQTGAKCLYGANRFTSAEECYKSCVVTGEPGCRVPRMQRACPLRQKRFGFYFDRSLSACVAWRTACLAPPNRHASYSACSEACEQNLLKKIIGG